MAECVKKHIITIIAIALILVAAIVTIVVVLATKGSDEDNPSTEPEQKEPLVVLLKDEKIEKPNRKIDAEFELVKLKNGMTGIIISDPYATKFHFQLTMKYGFYIDTDQGISHFGEHMVLQGSEKYHTIYPILNNFMFMKDVSVNAMTTGNFQLYYVTLPYNLKYETAMDIYTDAFRYPLYRADRVKNEIQAVNHEFYDRFYSSISGDIIRLLSNSNTPFNGMGCGNNQKLKPSESELLAKKLKGYHMVIKNPKNIFFTIYSNKTINESEQLAKSYVNYEMHKFKNDEIDVDDKQKLENNIKKLESIEIFDDNLYKHGIFYNTLDEIDILNIYYYIGKFDSKKLQFDIVDYINYLFNSKSLLQILKSKNYIAIDGKLSAEREDFIDNNHYFSLKIPITEEGLNNINNILLIINKYIEIMKNEGYKKDLYINFANYENNKDIFQFNKKSISSYGLYIGMFLKHLFFDKEKILLSGTYKEDNYNENLLKEYLNLIKFEKSFYSVNSKKKISELNNLDDIIDSKEIKKLKYYNVDYIYGKIPDNVGQDIYNKSLVIDNLSIREKNTYVSEKYREKVIPCYKEEINKCSEKNEFDYEKDEKYNPTKLEDNDIYETYYQIDKSSESHLVYSYIQFYIDEFEINNYLLFQLEKYYINNKLTDISDFLGWNFETNSMQYNVEFTSFSDNTEKIIKKFIDLLIEVPTKEDLDYSKIILKTNLYQGKNIKYSEYLINIFVKFYTGRENSNDIESSIELINNVDLESFQTFHNNLIKNIYAISTKIAGNIDVNAINNIHNYLKEKIQIENNNNLLKKPMLTDSSFVLNYYQKSTYESHENGIIVVYQVPANYAPYFKVFNACFSTIALKYLRFNKTKGYTPSTLFDNPLFIIIEQGLYKEVDQMQDDINSALSDLLNGTLTADYYNDIEESYQLEVEAIREKNFDNLFYDFKASSYSNSFGKISKTQFPETFAELVEIIVPVFTSPKRIDILVSRKDLSDEDFNLMYERRSKIEKYPLNEDVSIVHTTNINYLRPE